MATAISMDDPAALTRPVHVHFVCMGNIFRSVFAERLLCALRPDLAVSSSGLDPRYPGPHPAVIEIAREHGVQLDGHVPRTAMAPALTVSQAIYVFEQPILELFAQRFPDIAPRACFLGTRDAPLIIADIHRDRLDIGDPAALSAIRDAYQRIAAEIHRRWALHV